MEIMKSKLTIMKKTELIYSPQIIITPGNPMVYPYKFIQKFAGGTLK